MNNAAPPILELADASVIHGEQVRLERFSLRVQPGQHTVILGANGSGKSTLVKLIERRLYPRADGDREVRVRMFGQARWSVAELRQHLGVVSSDLQRAFDAQAELTALETVVSSFFASYGLGLDQIPEPAQIEAARSALEQLGAAHLASRRVATLSTGEARRVLIARALVHHPRALLLDEPCAGLDMASRRRFLEDLRALTRQGTTLVMVTHHVEEILPETRQLVLLEGGRCRARGGVDELLTEPRLSQLYGAPIALSRRGDWYSAHLA
ncbi:ATP-binding cassette domain-containing protein [Oleiagrimonas sp. C23AA]|nr:ATP-binding cassette domain-containing protein [Oleiagrimonas sp. C23AA]